MNQEETNVLQLLTGKSGLEEVSLEELERLATNHPFFSAVQLLLLKKMQQVTHPNLQQQQFKTALYFPNEAWLRYLLLETDNQNNNQPKSAVKNNQSDIEFEVSERTKEPESVIIVEENNAAEAGTIATENEPGPNIKPGDTENKNLVSLPADAVPEWVPVISRIEDEPEEAQLDDEELQQQLQPLPLQESQQKIAHILSEQAGVFHKPVEEKEDLQIEADPFYTVDYFASQGIKLDNKRDENTLDKKVHKFTDWLRQMKRINPHPVDLGTDSEEENQVANIAASSNQTKEVVTESMAEVLTKQGKQNKAIEVYQKLGLLYPHKIAYFAAKIQDIKQ